MFELGFWFYNVLLFLNYHDSLMMLMKKNVLHKILIHIVKYDVVDIQLQFTVCKRFLYTSRIS